MLDDTTFLGEALRVMGDLSSRPGINPEPPAIEPPNPDHWTYREFPTFSFFFLMPGILKYGFPGGSEVKNPPANAGDLSSIPGSGRSPGEGNGNPLQYSCLENPMDGEAWQATVHGVAKESDTTYQVNKNILKYSFFYSKIYPF